MIQNTKAGFWGSRFVEIYRQTFQLLKENPTVVILFFTIAVADFIALAVLFLAPSRPFSAFLAPIIRTFWSDYYLHYPNNFILLPKLFSHAHFLILSFFGIITTGIAIKKIEAHYDEGEKISAFAAVGTVFKKYFALMVAWFISYGVFVAVMRLVFPLLPPSVTLHLAVGYALGIVLQAFLAFLMPALLIAGQGFFQDLWSGIKFGFKNLWITSLLVAIPIAFIVGLSYLKALAPYFVRFNPEAVLWVLSAGIIITMFVDLWITSSTTLLYLKARKNQ